MQNKRAKPTAVSLKWCHSLNLESSPQSQALCAGDTIFGSCGVYRWALASTTDPEGWPFAYYRLVPGWLVPSWLVSDWLDLIGQCRLAGV